jgi:glycosyltransferase involved in cell wall biosynthesis
MLLLAERGSTASLRLHGANLEIQRPDFQESIRCLLDATATNVTDVGRYRPDELPSLMAEIDWVVVPSIWWENSPLVIQEAFAYGRPVICSDIGGMAEKVEHGVTGIHFRAGDAGSLAETVQAAVSDPSLWWELRSNLAPPHSMDEHVARLSELYRDLAARRMVASS